MTDVREQAAVIAISRRTTMGDPETRTGLTMPETVALLRTVGSALRLLAGEMPEGGDSVDGRQVNRIRRTVNDRDIAWGAQLIGDLKPGVTLTTVLDDDYPSNLHDIHDQPPLLFYFGTILPSDQRAIAVVGTRKASPAGCQLAYDLAAQLAEAGVTVVSGLAEGIDSAAHRGAMSVPGGRTIAVFGTGVNRIYPAANRDLAKLVVERGATISQFWPDSPPTRQSFPMRNVVTSGMAVGTVVVEAHGKSGSAQQARHALRHGRRLFLAESLVSEPWAKRLTTDPGTTVVASVDDVLATLDTLLEPTVEEERQLTLT